MSSPYLPSEELLRLLAALADGDLTEEQERQLAALLQQDPRARACYLDYMALLTSLQWEYATAAAPAEPGRRLPPSPRPPRWVPWGAVGLSGVAAGLVLALLLLWLRPRDIVLPPANRAEPTDDSVAMLLQAPGAVWGETSLPTRPGAALPAGWLHLNAGSAHIQFYSGATVVLEAPAELQLISAREAYCARGKLRATVPPQARGFTIGSPKWDLVDLGTEFGLRVDGGGKTEVHVFQGKVELYDAGSHRSSASRQEVTAGRGLRRDDAGAQSPIVSDSAAFRTAEQVTGLAEDETRRRHRAWLAASERLRQDPRLLVYYTFQTEQVWNRTLPDQVKGRPGARDGTIVGCEWTSGRWPGKQALEFKRPGDRVRINVPGEYASLTFMAWVRLDGLDHEFSGLLLTDDWGEGAPHWQISKVGEVILGVKHSNGKYDRFLTPPVFGPSTFEQWTHLAAVYDDRAGTATHYVNGRAASSQKILYPLPLQIGPAEIGNWGLPSRGNKVPIRNLNGRMDEFLLFSQALGPQEIQDLYQVGKPAE